VDSLYPWLRSNFKQLSASLKNSPHHAYLVSASDGLGKLNLVNNVIKYYLCDDFQNAQEACGVCSSCLLIDSGNHPDIHLVDDRDGDKISSTIKIDQIRKLSQVLATTSHIAKTKVVILTPAEKLNTQAANSFLKTLEEPQGDCLLFLISSKPYALPATILSRCLKMPVDNIDNQLATDWLQQYADTETTKTAYQLCHRSPLKTAVFLQNNLAEQRLACFDVFEKICLKKENLGSLSAWVAKEKVDAELIFVWIESWLSDLCKLTLNVDDKDHILNVDILDRLNAIQQKSTTQDYFKQQKRTAKIIAMDKTSLNGKVLLTELLANIVMC
jgi:DNA polymerase-3 subunit delta'